jgi:hypothetical protein
MTALPDTVQPPDHPLHALTTFELSDYRRRLEAAIALAAAPVQADLQARLDDVLAEQDDRARIAMLDDQRPEIVLLTSGELDRYANQLTRCLKALDTSAPIRMRVQHELAEVRTEQNTRARTGHPLSPKALRRRRPDRRRDAAEAIVHKDCPLGRSIEASTWRPRHRLAMTVPAIDRRCRSIDQLTAS